MTCLLCLGKLRHQRYLRQSHDPSEVWEKLFSQHVRRQAEAAGTEKTWRMTTRSKTFLPMRFQLTALLGTSGDVKLQMEAPSCLHPRSIIYLHVYPFSSSLLLPQKKCRSSQTSYLRPFALGLVDSHVLKTPLLSFLSTEFCLLPNNHVSAPLENLSFTPHLF